MSKKSPKKSSVSCDSLTERDGKLLKDGHQCYFFGDECLIPVASLEEARGRTVWYRESLFDNIKPIEIPER